MKKHLRTIHFFAQIIIRLNNNRRIGKRDTDVLLS